MNNQYLSLVDFEDIISRSAHMMYNTFNNNSVNTMFGMRIIHKEDEVILFSKCEYCGGTALDKRNNCASCGAPPSASEKMFNPYSILDSGKKPRPVPPKPDTTTLCYK